MDIKQHKQFLLSEIKVNDPFGVDSLVNKLTSKDELEETLGEIGYHWGTYASIKGYIEQISNDYNVDWDIARSAIDKIYEKYKEHIVEYDADEHEDEDLDEDVSNFKIGQTSQSDGHKTTVTDVDPTTQSVTWSVKKDITDKEVWDDLTKVIRKFEVIKTKDFHSRPKLIQLIIDLKTIRNKFSRTIQK